MPESNIDSTTGATTVDSTTGATIVNNPQSMIDQIDSVPQHKEINDVDVINKITNNVDTSKMSETEAVGERLNARAEYVADHPQTVPYTEDDRIKEQVLKAPELHFDYNGALSSGYSPSDIVVHLESKAKTFNIKAAKEAGFNDAQILKYLIHKKDKNNVDIANVLYGKTNDFEKGMQYAYNGIQATAEDIKNLVQNNPQHKQVIDDFHKYSVALDRARKDKDFLSMFTLGRAMPSLVTLPVSAQSKLGIFAMESVLGYSDARATEDVNSSLVTGAVAGSIGVGAQVATKYIGGKIADKLTAKNAQEENVKAIMNSLSPKAAKKTRQYFQDLVHMSDDEVEDATKQWQQISESTGNPELDKLLAITHQGSDVMVSLLGSMRRQDVNIFKVLARRKVERFRLMKSLIGSTTNLNDVIDALPSQYRVVEKNYDTVTSMLSDKYNIIDKIADGEDISRLRALSEDVDTQTATDAMQSVRTKLNRILNKNTLSVEDAIDAYKYSNDLLANSKGITKANYKKLSMKIDQHLKDTLTEEDYKHWRLVNDDYAMISRIKQSSIGKAFDSLHKKQVTPDEFLRLLKISKDGEQTFTDINNLIGSNKASALEKLIVKQFFETSPDKLSFEAVANSLNKKGFVTTEGKTLQDYVNKIAKAFNTEDRLNKSLSRYKAPEGGGLSANLMAKFKVFFASKIFKGMLKYIPDQDGKFLLMQANLRKALSKQPSFKQLDEVVGKLSEETKAKVFTDIQKQFEDWQDYMNSKAAVKVTEQAKQAQVDMERPKDIVPVGKPYSKIGTIDPNEPNPMLPGGKPKLLGGKPKLPTPNPKLPGGKPRFKSLPLVINNNIVLNKVLAKYLKDISPETITALKSPQGQEFLRRVFTGKISEKGFVRSLGIKLSDITNTVNRKLDTTNEGLAILKMIAEYKGMVLKQLKDVIEPYNGSIYHKTVSDFNPMKYNFNIAIKNNLTRKAKTGYDLGPGLYGHLDEDFYDTIKVGSRVIKYKGSNLKLLPVLNEREYLELVKFYTGKVGAKAKQDFNEYLEALGYDGIIARQSVGHKNMAALFKSSMNRLSSSIYKDRLLEGKKK